MVRMMKITIGIIAILMLIIGLAIYRQNQRPNIDLGLENGKLREIPNTPNCVSTQTSQVDKQVQPLAFKDSLEASKMALKSAFEAYGSIEIIEERDDYIYAVATTGLMKFHDDIEVYFDLEEEVIQYRSASRAGKSDLGLNKKRYEAIVALYNK